MTRAPIFVTRAPTNTLVFNLLTRAPIFVTRAPLQYVTFTDPRVIPPCSLRPFLGWSQ